MTALVLQVFLVGLSFAAVDQVLVFAFYARQDTLTPALVGVFSIGVYVAVVLILRGPLGIFSLMVADSVKQITHALITGALLSRRLGGFHRTELWCTLGKISAGSAAMGGIVMLALLGVRLVGLPSKLAAYLLEVGVPGAAGLAAYFFLVGRLNIAEARLLARLLRQKLGV